LPASAAAAREAFLDVIRANAATSEPGFGRVSVGFHGVMQKAAGILTAPDIFIEFKKPASNNARIFLPGSPEAAAQDRPAFLSSAR